LSKIAKWLQEKIGGPSGNLLPAHLSRLGEQPAVSFQDCIDAYLKDPTCKAFVDILADQVVGTGFYITVNEEYEKAEDAKSAVDGFCEDVNLDGLLQVAAREVVATGNSFWEKVEPGQLKDLRILPLTSISRIKRDLHGRVDAYVQSASYGGKKLSSERIIHFCWNPVDSEPFGTGVLRSLLEKMTVNGETRMSFLEMKARIERMLPEIFEKYAEYQRVIRSKPRAGARFVYNRPADVKTVQIDPRTQFQTYLEHIVNQVYLGGETPLPKLFTTPGFTEASAKTAAELAERKVQALQRFIKRALEREVFTPVIEQAGYDAKRAQVRLQWGIPARPAINMADILKAAELQLISLQEFRSLAETLGWRLEARS
jgi:hypothetical protein